jgi:excisionase family DNA binding protein
MTDTTNYSDLLTQEEVAEKLHLAKCTVHSMVSRGTLPCVSTRFGNLVPVEAVDEYAKTRLGKYGPAKPQK